MITVLSCVVKFSILELGNGSNTVNRRRHLEPVPHNLTPAQMDIMQLHNGPSFSDTSLNINTWTKILESSAIFHSNVMAIATSAVANTGSIEGLETTLEAAFVNAADVKTRLKPISELL